MPKETWLSGRESKLQGGDVCGHDGGVHDRDSVEGEEGKGLMPSLWSPGELLIDGGAEQ